jgi:hypothetical protein
VAEPIKPVIYFGQSAGIKSIDPADTFCPDQHYAVITQHPQMLRSTWLRDAEFPLHRLTEPAGRLFAVSQQLGDSAPDWICQRLEYTHALLLSQSCPELCSTPV